MSEQKIPERQSNKDKYCWVCQECRTAACWLGEFMCDAAIMRRAKVVRQSHDRCKKLGLEHSDYYTRTEVQIAADDSRVNL